MPHERFQNVNNPDKDKGQCCETGKGPRKPRQEMSWSESSPVLSPFLGTSIQAVPEWKPLRREGGTPPGMLACPQVRTTPSEGCLGPSWWAQVKGDGDSDAAVWGTPSPPGTVPTSCWSFWVSSSQNLTPDWPLKHVLRTEDPDGPRTED